MTTWLTPEQVAADPRLPLYNADAVRKLLRSGKLRGSMPGGRWLIPEEAIEEMLKAASNTARRKKKRAA